MVSEKIIEVGVNLAKKAAEAIAPDLSRETLAASTRILDGIYETSAKLLPAINPVIRETNSEEHTWQMSHKRPALKEIEGVELNVLEIGSNQDASAAHILNERLASYFSVDLTESNTMTQHWRASLDRANISTANKFRIKGDVLDLPVKSASMDAVLVSAVPPFLFREERASMNERALEEVARALKPGGKLILFHHGPEDVQVGQALLEKHFQTQSFVHPHFFERMQQKWSAFKFLSASPDTVLSGSVFKPSFIATK